jgi:F0F1-type ATP synthase delta subunit
MEQFDLSDFFKTKAQANDFSIRLSAISEKIYETGFDLEKALMEQFGIQKKDKFISYLRNNKINLESSSALNEILTKIQEKISSLSVISLTMAIEPNGQMIKALSDWFFLNINKQVLFDIQVDPNLIAGSTITYGGKYFDFSIRSIFEDVIKEVLAS